MCLLWVDMWPVLRLRIWRKRLRWESVVLWLYFEPVEQLGLLVLESEDLLLELGHALVAAKTVLLGGEAVALAPALLGREREGACGRVGIDGAAGGGGVTGYGGHMGRRKKERGAKREGREVDVCRRVL